MCSGCKMVMYLQPYVLWMRVENNNLCAAVRHHAALCTQPCVTTQPCAPHLQSHQVHTSPCYTLQHPFILPHQSHLLHFFLSSPCTRYTLPSSPHSTSCRLKGSFYIFILLLPAPSISSSPPLPLLLTSHHKTLAPLLPYR